MTGFRRSLKNSLRSVAAAATYARLQLARDSLAVLTYHRVLPRDHQDLRWEQPGMVVYEDTFAAQLGWLREAGIPVVGLADWLSRAQNQESLPGFAAAITFDDGWRDNYQYALPHLQNYACPATFFVCPGLLDNQHAFWPQRLGRGLASRHSEPEVRATLQQRFGIHSQQISGAAQIDQVINSLKGRHSDDDIHHMLDLAGLPRSAQDDERDLMNWRELNALVDSGLAEIGSHTRLHRRLNTLSDDEQRRSEICASRGQLESMLGVEVALFCYPNGDFDPVSERMVRACYDGACLTSTGWNQRGDDPFRVVRQNISQGAAAQRSAFMARLGFAL